MESAAQSPTHNGDAVWCGHSSCNTIEYERHFIAVEILFIFEFVYLFSITFPIWQNDAIVEIHSLSLPISSRFVCLYHNVYACINATASDLLYVVKWTKWPKWGRIAYTL